MGPNQAYKLLHSKGNQKQNENITYTLGENTCKQCDRQGLHFQNTQIAQQQPMKIYTDQNMHRNE